MKLRFGGEGLLDSGGDLGLLCGDLLRLLESEYGERGGGGGGAYPLDGGSGGVGGDLSLFLCLSLLLLLLLLLV